MGSGVPIHMRRKLLTTVTLSFLPHDLARGALTPGLKGVPEIETETKPFTACIRLPIAFRTADPRWSCASFLFCFRV